MNAAFRIRQTWTIARLHLGRVFFSRRSFWVYLLALFPAVVFLAHGIQMKIEYRWLSSRVTPVALLESIPQGAREDGFIEKVGKPVRDNSYQFGPKRQQFRHMQYFDGERRWDLRFSSGLLQSKQRHQIFNFTEDRLVFAGMFQFFYLRLAIFFGCLGIFANLFRGEMLDKTLHFWFLAPARREVLLAGKYLAGVIAALLIFTVGAVLGFTMMLWPHHAGQLTAYWQDQGLSHLFRYASAAALGCIGYGSIFLAFGLLFRNPIIPAIVILLWENINGILPTLLQKLSVLYYAQSLCPVPVPTNDSMPILIRLLISPADPPSTFTAVFGFLVVTALVLWVSSRIVCRLEINYNTE
jgi:ABC-type transport system involved in multi-copper enzyme maturation permease subunit